METGNFGGTATGAQTSANDLNAGNEETETSINSCGHVRELYYFPASGGSHNGWTGANLENDNPPTAAWDDQPYSFRDYGNQSCSSTDPGESAAAAAFLDLNGHTAASSSPAAGSSSLTPTQIASIATSMASTAGDVTPTSLQYVAAASRQAANTIATGDVVPGTTPSIVVAMQGNFVDNNVSFPKGASAPSGGVMTLVLDATSGQVTDLAISNTYPDLSALGAVSNAKPALTRR